MQKILTAIGFSCLFFIISNVVTANPSTRTISITCPGVAPSEYPYIVTNFRDYIGGYGKELIDGEPSYPNLPYFYFPIGFGANIPAKLIGYSNDSTDYDSTTGKVFCKYVNAGYDSFVASYQLTNGRGGSISAQTQNNVTIFIPIGLKKTSTY